MKSCHFEIGRKVIAAHYSHYRSFVRQFSLGVSRVSSCRLCLYHIIRQQLPTCHPAGTVISSVSQTSAGRPASVPLRPSTQTVDGMLGIISSSSSHILRRHKGPRGSWLAYGAFQWVEKSRKDPRKQFMQHFHTVRYFHIPK